MKLDKVIFWDFDGVLMNSNQVRDQGFIEVLKDFPDSQVKKLIEYHQKNGGLSRYVKFRYFFEIIRRENITDLEVENWAYRFSVIMKNLLVDPSLLIMDSIEFVKKKYRDFPMHIVSGSDGNELRYLCDQLDISKYFISIHGSPTPKIQLVQDLMEYHNYSKSESILIGDSINDYEAAKYNGIQFFGYNNSDLKCENYISNFKNISLVK